MTKMSKAAFGILPKIEKNLINASNSLAQTGSKPAKKSENKFGQNEILT